VEKAQVVLGWRAPDEKPAETPCETLNNINVEQSAEIAKLAKEMEILVLNYTVE